MGVIASAGAGAGSFSILIGATAARLPPEKRAFAAGFINAGGSFGQFIFAPLVQALIGAFGWIVAHVRHGGERASDVADGARAAANTRCGSRAQGSRAQASSACARSCAIAARDRSYWCLHAGFFTCGFHIAFLVTHLPGEVGAVRPVRRRRSHLARDHRARQHRRQSRAPARSATSTG